MKVLTFLLVVIVGFRDLDGINAVEPKGAESLDGVGFAELRQMTLAIQVQTRLYASGEKDGKDVKIHPGS